MYEYSKIKYIHTYLISKRVTITFFLFSHDKFSGPQYLADNFCLTSQKQQNCTQLHTILDLGHNTMVQQVELGTRELVMKEKGFNLQEREASAKEKEVGTV